jgi:hypothetical protein
MIRQIHSTLFPGSARTLTRLSRFVGLDGGCVAVLCWDSRCLKSASKLLRDSLVTSRGSLFLTIWLAAWLPGAAGCFYTETINREPRASVQVITPGPHYRGSPVTLSASKSDDPDDNLAKVLWRARACNAEHNDCDPSFDERTIESVLVAYDVTVPATRMDGTPVESLLVEATVIDKRDARHNDTVFVDVTNREPAPVLQLQGFPAPKGGFPLGTSVRVVVADVPDPDGDQVTYTWDYYPASGSQPENVDWVKVDDDIYALAGDVAGEWMVEVEATDVLGASVKARATVFFQQDGPPCIAATDPPALAEAGYIVERGAAPRRFAVLAVADDLDVYPPPPDQTADGSPSPQGTARFRWSIATPYTGDTLRPIRGHALAGYTIDPGAYAPGDTLRLRVEIEDRNAFEVSCGQEQPTCSIAVGDSACLQRVTWRIDIR